MNKFEIVHNDREQMFSIDLEGNSAYVKYRFPVDGVVDFYKTFVPPEHRSHGLAAQLVERALDWAEQQELQIEASCWYAAKKLAQRMEI